MIAITTNNSISVKPLRGAGEGRVVAKEHLRSDISEPGHPGLLTIYRTKMMNKIKYFNLTRRLSFSARATLSP
jgi:hypothetical protein